MKKILLPLLAMSLLIAAGCSSLQVETKQADGVDMSQYKTFNFDTTPDPDKDPVLFSEINQKYVRDAITKELRAKGYSKSNNPDLLLSLYLRVEDKQKVVRMPGSYSGPRYYGGYGYYGYYSGYQYDEATTYTVNTTIGTLIIDSVDTQKNELVWQGIAQDVLKGPSSDPQKIVESVMKKVFKKYPPAAGSTK